jgi:hypothetical protein
MDREGVDDASTLHITSRTRLNVVSNLTGRKIQDDIPKRIPSILAADGTIRRGVRAAGLAGQTAVGVSAAAPTVVPNAISIEHVHFVRARSDLSAVSHKLSSNREDPGLDGLSDTA